jgi:hypothetical protein
MANEDAGNAANCQETGEETNGQILPKLAAHIQAALGRLQNPPDCQKARLLICKVPLVCQFKKIIFIFLFTVGG